MCETQSTKCECERVREPKVTRILLDRVKYFINAIENGEYEPKGYEFTIVLHSEPNCYYNKVLKIEDSYAIQKQ